MLEPRRAVVAQIPDDVHWASLEIAYRGRHNGLNMMLVSTSQGERYSLRSVMNWVTAITREGWIWRAGGEYNTLLAVFNSDTQDARVAISLDYSMNGVRRSYNLPERTMAARTSELVNIRDIIQAGTPDADGDVIPPDIGFGGYRVRKTGPNAIGNLTTEALIFRPGSSALLSIYNTGCCQSRLLMYPTSLSGAAGSVGTVMVYADDECTGTQDYTSDPGTSWSSSDITVAEPNPFGVIGLVSGGTASVTARVSHWVLLGTSCRIILDSASCSVTVKPSISSITPARSLIGNQANVVIRGRGFGNDTAKVQVQAGSGITVTVDAVQDDRIDATFNIATNAPAGNHSVTVTVRSQTSVNSVNYFVQVPTYFLSPSAVQTGTPQPCTAAGATGYFITVSYYVADQDGIRISQSGMTPGENLGDGVWHDDFATPTTTRTDGSFDDTPFGACYGTSGHFCAAGSPQSFRITNNGTVYSIATNTTSRKCTDGIRLVIQGNPAAQNKTYTFGNIQ